MISQDTSLHLFSVQFNLNHTHTDTHTYTDRVLLNYNKVVCDILKIDDSVYFIVLCVNPPFTRTSKQAKHTLTHTHRPHGVCYAFCSARKWFICLMRVIKIWHRCPKKELPVYVIFFSLGVQCRLLFSSVVFSGLLFVVQFKSHLLAIYRWDNGKCNNRMQLVEEQNWTANVEGRTKQESFEKCKLMQMRMRHIV